MYKLHLTEEEMQTIYYVGHRYNWSDWLNMNCNIGDNELPEHVAWEMEKEFLNDATGGHGMFPMLDRQSDLWVKLHKLLEEIV